MKLSEALKIQPGVTAIIGGGGKTTLMECLAGRTVCAGPRDRVYDDAYLSRTEYAVPRFDV